MLFKSKDHKDLFEIKKERSNIPWRYENAFLDYYQTIDKATEERKVFIQDYLNAKYESEPNLILLGDKGTGKTHFVCTILNELMLRKNDVYFVDQLALFQNIKEGYATNTAHKYLKKIRDVLFLAIDDLGCCPMSDDDKKNLFYILNDRYNNELPTIITSNQPNLDFLSSTIVDRILENAICKNFNGQSLRGRFQIIKLDEIDCDLDVMTQKWQEQANDEKVTKIVPVEDFKEIPKEYKETMAKIYNKFKF